MSQNPYGSYGNNQPEEPENPYQSDPQAFEAQKNSTEQINGSYAAPQNPQQASYNQEQQSGYGQSQNSSQQYGSQQYGSAQPQYSSQQYGSAQPNQAGAYQQNQANAYPQTSGNTYQQQGGNPYNAQNPNANTAGNTYGGVSDLCAPRPQVSLGGALSRWTKNLFHFSGRASRSEFWWVYGAVAVIGTVLGTIFMIPMVSISMKLTEAQNACDAAGCYGANLAKYTDYENQMIGQVLLWFLLLCLLSLVLVFMLLSVAWRRIQDAGYHGALALLYFVIPIVPFVMAFMPSSEKGCKYDKPIDAQRP